MKLEKKVSINDYELYKNYLGNSVVQIKLCIIEPPVEFLEYLKKYNHCDAKLTLDVEEPILDEAEKRYLRDVIRPFKDRVEYIEKFKTINIDKCYIYIKLNDDSIPLPNFDINSMYKGMQLSKAYTLEELGL